MTGGTARTAYQKAAGVQKFLIVYSLAEGLVSVAGGVAAGSAALMGFGLDSFIEVAAAVVVLWRLRASHASPEAERRERLTLRVIAVTFFLLAAYVLFEAAEDLAGGRPEKSWVGVAVAVSAVAAMTWAGARQMALGREIGSKALLGNAKETFACLYLALTLLLGLGLNALLGWWWADPAAALLMVPLLLKEGLEALRESREQADLED